MEEELVKRGRGRPVTKNVKEIGSAYYLQYYHATKEGFICTCGDYVVNKSMNRHLKSKKHNYLAQIRNMEAELRNIFMGGSVIDNTILFTDEVVSVPVK
jgi:hypothetical protein